MFEPKHKLAIQRMKVEDITIVIREILQRESKNNKGIL
jgi:hypothetical protein